MTRYHIPRRPGTSYEPIEQIATPSVWRHLTQLEAARVNPPRRRKPQVVFPDESYRGLRVRVVVLRDPGFDPTLEVQIEGPADVYALLRENLQDDPQENFLVLPLNAEPSNDDKALTRRLKAASHDCGLELLDHVIIGRDRWTSFADRGLL